MDEHRVDQVSQEQSRLEAAEQLYQDLQARLSFAIAALEEAAAYCEGVAGSELDDWDEKYFRRTISYVRCLPAKVQAIYLMTPEVASAILSGETFDDRSEQVEE